jgi:hypothetical protein
MSFQSMRVVFCTSGGILGSIALTRLFEDPDIRIVGLVRSCKVFDQKMSFPRGAISFFLRCGIPYTIYLWLITTVSEFLGQFSSSSWGSTGGMAKKRKIPVITTRDINTAGGYKFLAALSPDLLISAFFDQKFEAGLCDGVTYSVINIHPSFLPENKGVDPVFHAVLNGSDQVGVTLHRVTEKFDSGAILAQKQLPRDSSGSVLFTYRELMAAGMDLLLSSKHLLLNSSAGTIQREIGTYQSWPSAKGIRQLYFKGGRLMRWKDLRRS